MFLLWIFGLNSNQSFCFFKWCNWEIVLRFWLVTGGLVFWWESYVMIEMTVVIFAYVSFCRTFTITRISKVNGLIFWVITMLRTFSKWRLFSCTYYAVSVFSMTPYANSNHDVINDDIMTTDDNDIFCNEWRFLYTLRGPFFRRTYISSTVTPTDIIRLRHLCHRLLCNNSAETILWLQRVRIIVHTLLCTN